MGRWKHLQGRMEPRSNEWSRLPKQRRESIGYVLKRQLRPNREPRRGGRIEAIYLLILELKPILLGFAETGTNKMHIPFEII